MPTEIIQIRESNETRPQKTFSKTAEISTLKTIASVRVVNNKFGTDVQASKISYSIDQETLVVTVVVSALPHTDVTTVGRQYNLVNSNTSGGSRYCTYANGTTRTLPLSSSCALSITVSEDAFSYDYDIIIDYVVNTPPSITSETPDLDALYEGDIYTVGAEVNEPDAGDAVMVYVQIGNDVPQNIAYFTSDSLPLLVERDFMYRSGQLVDTESDYVIDVPELVMHTVRIWAEDNYGGKSEVLEKEFTVDSNQPPQVTVNPFTTMPFLLADEQITITGSAMDPNGGEYKLSYRLDEGSWFDTYEGTDSPFSIALPLPLLTENSVLQIRAVDEFDAADEQIVDIEKELVRYPLHRSDIKYRINIPSRKAQTMTLKVMREIGDLTVTANVSMTGGEVDELYVAMTKTGTQAAAEGMEEDTFSYTATEPMEKILFQIVMERQDVSSTAKVRRVTGTLN